MIESQEQFEDEIKKGGWCVTVLSKDTGRRNGVPVPEFVRLTGFDTVEKYIHIFTSDTHTAIVSSVGNFTFKTPLRTFAFNTRRLRASFFLCALEGFWRLSGGFGISLNRINT